MVLVALRMPIFGMPLFDEIKLATRPFEIEVPEGLAPSVTDVYLPDLAREAYNSGQLVHLALGIQGIAHPVTSSALRSLSAFEMEWDAFRESQWRTQPSREELLAKLISNSPGEGPQSAWSWARLDPRAHYQDLDEKDLASLQTGLQVIDFLENKKSEGRQDATYITDFLENGHFNCMVNVLMGLHLFQRCGEDSFWPYAMPFHTTLALIAQNRGLAAFLDDNRFLPPEYYYSIDAYGDIPVEYRLRREPWTAIADVLNNLSRTEDGTHPLPRGLYSTELPRGLYSGALKHALEIDPNHPIASVNLAWILRDLGFKDRSIEILRYALERNPYNWHAKHELEKLTS